MNDRTFLVLFPLGPLFSLSHHPPPVYRIQRQSDRTSINQPVVHEYYDEVVITDPTEGFHQQLQRLAETKTPRHTLHVRACVLVYTCTYGGVVASPPRGWLP